jgi:hypothetical protein
MDGVILGALIEVSRYSCNKSHKERTSTDLWHLGQVLFSPLWGRTGFFTRN